MDPVTITLGAISALGGIIGAAGGKKAIDPEVLRKLFGPDAINNDTIELFNKMINSPVGQQKLAAAAQTGASFSNALNQRLAQSGLAGGGATSGVGAFTQAAGTQAGAGLEAGVRGDIYQQALDAALQNISQRLGIYAGSQQIAQQQPSAQQIIGSSIAGAAGGALANYTKAPKIKASLTVPNAAARPAASQFAAPAGTNYTELINRRLIPPNTYVQPRAQ